MSTDLMMEVAETNARKLKSIPGYSWDEENVLGTADALVRWCKGAIIDGIIWSPERQAEYVIAEALDNWDKWKSIAALRAIFLAKFKPKQQGPAYQSFAALGEKPPVECAICEDRGTISTKTVGPKREPIWEYCSCSQAAALKQMYDDKWLEMLNRKALSSSPRVLPVDSGPFRENLAQDAFRRTQEKLEAIFGKVRESENADLDRFPKLKRRTHRSRKRDD